MPAKRLPDKDVSRGKRFEYFCITLSGFATKVALSSEIDYPESTMRNWEKGHPIPLLALARLHGLGLNTNWLITGEGHPVRGTEDGVNALREEVEHLKAELVEAKKSLLDARKRAENAEKLADGQEERINELKKSLAEAQAKAAASKSSKAAAG